MPRPYKYKHVLRTARVSFGLTQRQLAKQTGLSTVAINKIENGQIQVGRRGALAIKKVIGLDVYQLLTNTDPDNPRYESTFS